MLQKLFSKENERWSLPLLWLAASVLGFMLYGAYFVKPAGVLAGCLLVRLFWTRDLRALRVPFVWPLLGYVVFAALTAIWAMSGKFFLREYLKVFLGAAICAALLLKPRFDADTVRRALSFVAGTSAVYAFLSVESAVTGVSGRLLAAYLPNAASSSTGWQGVRLYGIFGNSNLEAAIFSVGIILSVALLCAATERRARVAYAVTLSFNAFAFLLVFSMGAIACFAVAVALYLVFAGEGRAAALTRMLEGAAPALAAGMAAYVFFSRGKDAAKPVLLVMLLAAAATAALELTVAPRLLGVLDAHRRLTSGFLIGALAAVGLYAVLAVSVHAPYTFGGALNRSAELTSGAHTLTLDADGDVSVYAYSQSRDQVLRSSGTALYRDIGTELALEVPEDALAVRFQFSAEEGVTLRSVTIDGTRELPLRYPLLPGFAADRIQGIRASSSSMSRAEMWRDGLKLWRLSPIVGLGLGAFETGVSRVQEVPYTTRFVHSHFIQTLLETGVIGFALWMAALGAMFVVLWRRRGDTASPYRAYYAAAWAALAMLALQSAWDASLSFVIVVLYAWTIFGVTLRAFAVEPETAAGDTAQPKKKCKAAKREVTLPRVAAVLFPAVFTLTLLANMYAQHKLVSAFDARSYNEFFSAVDLAAKLDAYEHNDAKLSYVRSAADNRADVPQSVLDRAEQYAAELSRVQSNTIPQTLTAYYLTMGEDEKAVGAAKLAATYSASNSTVWNETADLLRTAFSANYYAPLLKDAAPLVRELLEYRALLDARNETALVPFGLSAENEDFFKRVARLDPYPADDPARVFELLSAEG